MRSPPPWTEGHPVGSGGLVPHLGVEPDSIEGSDTESWSSDPSLALDLCVRGNSGDLFRAENTVVLLTLGKVLLTFRVRSGVSHLEATPSEASGFM